MTCKVENAVIPVAGMGTRMLPATKSIPKEMLPLIDKPLIQFVVDECVMAGIHNIIFITHASKYAIENYFDTNLELESILKHRIKNQLLSEIRSICPSNVTIIQMRQGLIKGLGHAVLRARPLLDNKPVAVILPDVIINKYCANLNKDNLPAMLERFSRTGYSQILVKPVQNVSDYGIVDCQGKILKPGGNMKIVDIMEKPVADRALSNLAVVGRYIFSSKIWVLLEKIAFRSSNEIHLTDAISMLIKEEIVEAYRLIGLSYDCGNKFGYMQAFVSYAMHHAIWGKKFTTWLKNI